LATVPSSGTNIRFLSGIPFSNDYKHTRWFDTLSDQLNWWANQTTVYTYSDFNIQRVEDKTFIRLNVDIDSLWGVNYVVFYNKTQGRHFYAFVTKLEYIQKNRTDVHIQLDVVQTWMFDMIWKPSYVVREHCPLWNNDGSPVINTIPEDLNYGTEYTIKNVQHYRPYADLYFLVVVTKKPIHSEAIKNGAGFTTSVNGLPQPLCFYVHPFYLNNDIVPASNLSLSSQVTDVILAMYSSTDAVNNVVSMYVTDILPEFPPYDANAQSIIFDTSHYTQATIGTVHTIYVDGVQYTSDIFDLGGKYDGFTSVSESKLLMHPYTVTVIDDFRGNRIELKNEYIDNTNLLLDVKGSLGISNKVSYSIKDYLNGNIADDTLKDMVSAEHALIDQNPNDIPVLVDMLSAYIQGNRNSLKNQINATLFNGWTQGIGSGIGALAGIWQGNAVGVASSATGMVSSAGNTVFQLQALQAKQQDISNVPPSIAKMGSNSYFDYGNGYTGIWVIKKEITPEYRKKLTDFFNLYGYKKNEVKIPNFHTRQYWNFVQTKSCVIQGNFNHEDLEDIKSVFDGGITLWHTDDIGNYSLSNGVIA
jgi:hypothetical protein